MTPTWCKLCKSWHAAELDECPDPGDRVYEAPETALVAKVLPNEHYGVGWNNPDPYVAILAEKRPAKLSTPGPHEAPANIPQPQDDLNEPAVEDALIRLREPGMAVHPTHIRVPLDHPLAIESRLTALEIAVGVLSDKVDRYEEIEAERRRKNAEAQKRHRQRNR